MSEVISGPFGGVTTNVNAGDTIDEGVDPRPARADHRHGAGSLAGGSGGNATTGIVAITPSDVAVAGTTYENISGFTFAIAASEKWAGHIQMNYGNAADSVGATVQLTVPAGATFGICFGTGQTEAIVASWGFVTFRVLSSLIPFYILNSGTAGTVQVQIKKQGAGNFHYNKGTALYAFKG